MHLLQGHVALHRTYLAGLREVWNCVGTLCTPCGVTFTTHEMSQSKQSICLLVQQQS